MAEGILFGTDLDNTLIYSYKHEIGAAKRCVERYQGREVSFVSERTYELLVKIKNNIRMVPVTTRTEEQYRRIDLGIGAFSFALVCNGGVLLVDGKEDVSWYEQSLALVQSSAKVRMLAREQMERDEYRCFEVRNIRNLFLFTKSSRPEVSAAFLRSSLDVGLVDVFYNGVKVYVVPKALNKGCALMRLQKKLCADYVVAAGDSEFDVPMLNTADLGLAPAKLKDKKSLQPDVVTMPGERLFSEELLAYALNFFHFN